VGCYIVIYLLTSMAALFATERREGQATGFCGACRYDLTGLAAGAVCPECGSAARELSPAWTEIVMRPRGLAAWCITFVVLMFCAMEQELLHAAIDWPWRVISGNWTGTPRDTPDGPVFIAIAFSPLLARVGSSRAAVLATLGALLAGYVFAVCMTLR
jgi:hypothetical protein